METISKDSPTLIKDTIGLRQMDSTTPMAMSAEFAPGLPWFFYWKFHPSQWKNKFLEMKASGVSQLIIPLNWAHHSKLEGSQFFYDFGTTKIDTDLKELDRAIKDSKLKATFLLPLGPLPYLTHGGVPPSLVRNRTHFEDGRAITFLDPLTKKLIQYPSYFGAAIFKEFCHWVQVLGQYLSSVGWANSIVVAESGYFDRDLQFHFLGEDFGVEMQKKWKSHQIRVPKFTVHAFQEDVLKLYRSVAKEMLGAALWNGEMRIAFLGHDPQLILSQVSGVEVSELQLSQELKIALQSQVHPIKMPDANPKALESFQFLYKKLCSAHYLQHLFSQSIDDLSMLAFRSWTAAAIIGKWEDLAPVLGSEGLQKVLDTQFQGHLQLISETQLTKALKSPEDDDDWWTKLVIAPLAIEHDPTFHSLLAHFLSGGKVVINIDSLTPMQTRKLELLILENQLKESQFNAPIHFRLLTLGDGQLIVYEGKSLTSIKVLHTKIHFWSVIFAQMQRNHLPLTLDSGISGFWMERKTSPRELNYSSIRRLLLINFSSEKKQMSFFPNKSFAFSKIIEQNLATIQQSGASTKVILETKGFVILEFGYLIK